MLLLLAAASNPFGGGFGNAGNAFGQPASSSTLGSGDAIIL